MAKRPEHRSEFADFSTERLMELRDEYRAGRVKLVEREPDAEVRARLNAVPVTRCIQNRLVLELDGLEVGPQ
jgi:hypothetical protein